MQLELSFAVDEREVTLPLVKGDVTPEGINLIPITSSNPSEKQHRMFVGHEFDICEMALGTYLASLSNPEKYPFTAIPVFPNRKFRHRNVYVHSEAGIENPKELAGKRVGLKSGQTTAGIWMRGILQSQYGLDITNVIWVIENEPRVPVEIPNQFDVRTAPSDKRIEELLVDGEIDAAIDPRPYPSCHSPETNVSRLFENPIKHEQQYHEETGILPVMHTIGIKKDIVADHPWIVESLYNAFCRARDKGLQWLENMNWTTFSWAPLHLKNQWEGLSKDKWEYGLTEGNVEEIELLMKHAKYQGQMQRDHAVESLFETPG